MMKQDIDQGTVPSVPSSGSNSKPLKSILRKPTSSFNNFDKRRRSWPTFKTQRSVSFSGDRQSRWQEAADSLDGPPKCSLGLRMPVRRPDDSDDDDSISTHVSEPQFEHTSSESERRQAPRMPVRRANSDDMIIIELFLSNNEKNKQCSVIESNARQFARRKVRFINRVRGMALSA